MKTPSLLLVSVLMLVAAFAASGRTVTLTVTGWTGSPGYRLTNEVAISENETVEIVGWLSSGADARLQFTKSGVDFTLYSITDFHGRTTFSGPTTVQLVTTPGSRASLITLNITPDAFPPSQALVLPAGPGGANIALEASHDLIHWTNAPPGIYTNPPANLFFRIRADRLP